MSNKKNNWTEVIESSDSLFKINFKELIDYKDLLIMFVKRDFAATYKQTILGPLWFFIQPILTTLIFTIVFGKFANLKTDVEPKFLFYFSGVVIWNYFSDCFIKTSTVFKDNAQLFGKVFFPRLIMPLSIVVSGLIKFSIQFLLFIVFVVYYHLQNHTQIHPNFFIALTPIYLLLMAGLAFGGGLVVAALTTKYRDLSFLVSFGVQLLMYATPIIYSSKSLNPNLKMYVQANPLSSVVESFRTSFLGGNSLEIYSLMYSFIFMIAIIFCGMLLFNKVQQKFIDTV